MSFIIEPSAPELPSFRDSYYQHFLAPDYDPVVCHARYEQTLARATTFTSSDREKLVTAWLRDCQIWGCQEGPEFANAVEDLLGSPPQVLELQEMEEAACYDYLKDALSESEGAELRRELQKFHL